SRCHRGEEECRPLACETVSGLMRTRLTPAFTMPSLLAAPRDKSMLRPRTNGPRSVMRTRTDLPLDRLVTSTGVPSGRVRWAAVSAYWLDCPAGRRVAVKSRPIPRGKRELPGPFPARARGDEGLRSRAAADGAGTAHERQQYGYQPGE